MASSAPAAPPRQGTPGWVWALIGCAVLFFLATVACGVAATYFSAKLLHPEPASTSLTFSEAEQRFGAGAIYPGSENAGQPADILATLAAVKGLGGTTTIEFSSDDPPELLVAWYDANNKRLVAELHDDASDDDESSFLGYKRGTGSMSVFIMRLGETETTVVIQLHGPSED